MPKVHELTAQLKRQASELPTLAQQLEAISTSTDAVTEACALRKSLLKQPLTPTIHVILLELAEIAPLNDESLEYKSIPEDDRVYTSSGHMFNILELAEWLNKRATNKQSYSNPHHGLDFPELDITHIKNVALSKNLEIKDRVSGQNQYPLEVIDADAAVEDMMRYAYLHRVAETERIAAIIRNIHSREPHAALVQTHGISAGLLTESSITNLNEVARTLNLCITAFNYADARRVSIKSAWQLIAISGDTTRFSHFADRLLKDDCQRSFIHYAAMSGQKMALEWADNQYKPTVIFQRDYLQRTAAHYAVNPFNSGALDWIAEHYPILLYSKDENGNTIIDEVLRLEHFELLTPVLMLLDNPQQIVIDPKLCRSFRSAIGDAINDNYTLMGIQADSRNMYDRTLVSNARLLALVSKKVLRHDAIDDDFYSTCYRELPTALAAEKKREIIDSLLKEEQARELLIPVTQALNSLKALDISKYSVERALYCNRQMKLLLGLKQIVLMYQHDSKKLTEALGFWEHLHEETLDQNEPLDWAAWATMWSKPKHSLSRGALKTLQENIIQTQTFEP